MEILTKHLQLTYSTDEVAEFPIIIFDPSFQQFRQEGKIANFKRQLESIPYFNKGIYVFPLIFNQTWVLVIISILEQTAFFYNHYQDRESIQANKYFVTTFIEQIQDCFDFVKYSVQHFAIKYFF